MTAPGASVAQTGPPPANSQARDRQIADMLVLGASRAEVLAFAARAVPGSPAEDVVRAAVQRHMEVAHLPLALVAGDIMLRLREVAEAAMASGEFSAARGALKDLWAIAQQVEKAAPTGEPSAG